jgi:hypothetical protein
VILKSITPQHFGPFGHETTLQLDPEVTVLTGPNDVGKSLTLRAIEILLSKKAMDIHEVNRDRSREVTKVWTDDSEIVCTGVFEATNASTKGGKLPKEIKQNYIITVRRQMNANVGQIVLITAPSGKTNPNAQFNPTIAVLKLPLESEVRQQIEFVNMNEAEDHFIRFAFGSGFTLDKHKSNIQVDRAFRIREAEANLNGRLQKILPSTMPLQFMLTEVGDNPELLGVGIVDKHKGFTPLGSRGAGVRKILNVMGALLRIDPDAGHSIVLYDEPETSLHADAQHMLRRLLESIATHPNVQVVYTTHSPAMINTFRPNSLRVLERRNVKDKAVSVFINEAFDGNFLQVRSSLGVSPADSLLYAPITIIAEGKSEVFGLPALLKKLADAGIIDGTKLSMLLPLTHILDGEGSSFRHMCHLAVSQNATPIVFLDGDKQSESHQFSKDNPEIRVVSLTEGLEVEDLISRDVYFRAISEILGGGSTEINEQAFVAWEKVSKPKPSTMFSKRVERWLYETDLAGRRKLVKHVVLSKAIMLADASQIHADPLKRLFEAMVEVGNSL